MPVATPPPSISHPLQLPLSALELSRINAHLSSLSPQEILQWGILNLPRLHQTTAFGLTGLATIDMMSKFTPNPPPLIFVDTLYHFAETLELVGEIKKRYGVPIHIFRPAGCETVEAFESRHGERLWETDEDSYDFLVKVEPARRAYTALDVQSVITGRRASQGASRATLSPLEVDSTGLFKLNPFFAWSFFQVQSYIDENHVPRNKLIVQGYRSIGDWHSTGKSGEGDAGERAGRWQGREKTECGLHKDYFLLKKLAKEKVSYALLLETTVLTYFTQREEEMKARDESRGENIESPEALLSDNDCRALVAPV
ncbi:Phosphoadenosine phosphosulfate reductase thioredoxin [Gautieria morchelliformis]|nr:Phosphoadenosine phosphosulfate reductase thioredoxin [Gautieria morchelliformis]